jgi:hypothetical protein
VQAAVPVDNYFLNAFGESHREFLADIDPKLEPNLVQTLHMINSSYVNDKVAGGRAVEAALQGGAKPEAVVRSLYVRTVSRVPSPAETKSAMALIAKAKDPREAAQDLLWALVTSREFYFNH